jgi:DNA-binding NtrC family response regulator
MKDPEQQQGPTTEAVGAVARGSESVRRFRLVVAEGREVGRTWDSTGDRATIGSHESNDLVLDDRTVSRFHCEIWIDWEGAHIRDLDSRNGTTVDGLRIKEAWLREGSLIRLGKSSVRFAVANEINRLPLSSRSDFGSLCGSSVAMRAVFAQLERAAATDATVLIEGETGTGKEGAARAIHDAGARKEAPFIIVDCGAVPANILESELFGHERGAFTGAVSRRIGAFEAAAGGTLVLDEIGELPLDLQPKLLRVLEQRHIRRVGANEHTQVDVRVIAATNRDLRNEVNGGRFRSDLYFRLAVLRIALPPLRTRPDDIPLLVERFAKQLQADSEQAERLRAPEMIENLQRGSWPGNVRELRNYLERCLVFDEVPAGVTESPAPSEASSSAPIQLDAPFVEARRSALASFERAYVQELMKRHRGVSAAARAADIDRNYLYRLLNRHGLR